MNKTLVIATLATCLVTSHVFAAESGLYGSSANTNTSSTTHERPGVHRTFLKLDINKDGYIERTEAKTNAALARDFAKVAKNGKLSESEFSAWEIQHDTAPSGMTKTKHEKMPMQNSPADPLGSPKTGGGAK